MAIPAGNVAVYLLTIVYSDRSRHLFCLTNGFVKFSFRFRMDCFVSLPRSVCWSVYRILNN